MYSREYFFDSERDSGEYLISNREYEAKKSRRSPAYVHKYETMPKITNPMSLAAYVAAPDNPADARFVLQIFHGVCERYERYKGLIREIVGAGGIAVIHDMRGHGLSIGENQPGFTGGGGKIWQNYIIDADFARAAALDYCEEYAADIYNNEGNSPEYDEQGYSTQKPARPAADFRSLPFYVMGFSMGAMIAAMYASHAYVNISGLILAGLPKRESPLPLSLGLAGLNLISLFFGEDYCSPMLNRIGFSHYNRGFEREPYSDGKFLWLSNDYQNRLSFAADPLCFHPNPVILYETLFRLVRDLYRPASWDVPDKNMLILLMAGELDPVSGGDDGVLFAEKFLHDMEFRRISVKMYRGMRHEIFYDYGKEEPTGDLIEFLGGLNTERKYDKIEIEAH